MGGNRLLLALAALVVGLQALVVTTPLLERFFDVVPLSLSEFGLAAAIGSAAFVAIEVEKWWLRRCAPSERSLQP